MVNKNYIKGRAFEYKVKKYFEELGYMTFRSAGSHSIADLIVLLDDRVILLQCKAKDLTNKEIDKIEKEAAEEIKKYKRAKNKNIVFAVLGINNFKYLEKIGIHTTIYLNKYKYLNNFIFQ